MGSTLDTAGLTQVLLTGGAQASIVFWQVGGSATLGIDSVFAGNVLALTSSTVGAGANIDGRLLAENAHATLGGGNNFVTASAIPEPATSALLAALGVFGLAFWHRRRAAVRSGLGHADFSPEWVRRRGFPSFEGHPVADHTA